MSEPIDTSGRPLSSTAQQQEQQSQATGTVQQWPARIEHRKTSSSSNEQVEVSKSPNSRRRQLGSAKQESPGPHNGSSRSTTSPTNMASQLPPVNYTRTGRISKAKKGLKVHNCENCGRVSVTHTCCFTCALSSQPLNAQDQPLRRTLLA